MPYDDFVRSVPNPQLSLFMNALKPGVGTFMTAFYGPNGFCMKTFAIALAQALTWDVLFLCWFLGIF